MPKYYDEYPEITDWEEDTYEMPRHYSYPVRCFPYEPTSQIAFMPLPFMMQTPEGPIFIRYARNGTRPIMNCYPNLCYPIYITHK
ncbi:MAG: hypothetical protein LLG02_13560 [Pelosinus sp.]|nr:hypothetical protein [Pelosinus sp.]